MSTDKKPKFEEALKRLEEIVSLMEGDKLPLEESLARYEEGIKLARFCAQTLDAAEKRIEIISRGEGGEEKIEPFSPDNRGEAPEPESRSPRKPPKAPRPPDRDDTGEQFLF